ncbi:MAG: Na+/H+ antiporter, partial [Arthrobacter koreensis]|nr:Na+/H+ antiporter [Arthrobacter koreensis]
LATLALALAMPATTLAGEPLPGRNFMIVCAGAVLLVTLVLPGLTLPWLMRRLKLPSDHGAVAKQERELARRAERVALETMKRSRAADKLPAERRAALARRMSSLHSILERDSEADPQKMLQMKATLEVMDAVQREALAAARQEVLAARRQSGMDPEAVDRVLRRLDLRTVTLDRSGH